LGMKEMGSVACLSKGDLYCLFGEEGEIVWELVRGIDRRPLRFEPVRPLVRAVGACLEEVLQEALAQGPCKAIEVRCGGVRAPLRFSRPIGDWRRIFQHLLDRGARFPEGEEFEVKITEPVVWREEQLTFWRQKAQLPKGMRLIWDEPGHRLPERRAHLEGGRAFCRPKGVQVQWPHAVATKGVWRKVQGVAERWVVDEDWWTGKPIHREYYRVDLDNGARVRLFREAGRWFRQ